MSLTEPEFACETYLEVCAAVWAVLPSLNVSICNCCIEVLQVSAFFSVSVANNSSSYLLEKIYFP